VLKTMDKNCKMFPYQQLCDQEYLEKYAVFKIKAEKIEDY